MDIFNKLVRNKDAGIVLSAALLFIGFSLSSESFLSAYNLFNISRIIAFSAFVALAQAVVLVAGGMNLSVGAVGGLAGEIIGGMGLAGHFDDFKRGVIDTKDIVYFVSVIVFFLFLSVRTLESRRWR